MTTDERFERAFHVNPNPMSLSTLNEGRFIDVNDALLRVTGYSREELIGRTSVELGMWADPERSRAAVVSQLSTRGNFHDLEVPMRMKNGDIRTFIMAATVINDAGQPMLVSGFEDVTERRAMENALRKSESRYREFIEDLPLGIVVTQNGTIRFTNTALREMVGFTAEELHDKPFLPFVFEEDRPWLIDLHQRRMRGEKVPDTYECRFATKAGDLRTWHLQTRTIDWDGPAAIGVVSDVTEARRTDAELKLAASVFDRSSEAIIIADADTRIIAVNDAFVRLTGYTREEALARKTNLLKSDRHGPEFYAEMWRALADVGEWRGDLWNRRKDGTIFAVHESISRIRDDEGRTSHFVSLFSDITDTKLHQQQLEHMAHFDALTGLPNRALLSDRLQLALAQAERAQELLAVCYLDLDEFKPINDKYGHEVGDDLLMEVAHRLKSCIRGGDTVARLGGDEFVLLLGGLETVDECEKALERLVTTLAVPYELAEKSHVVSASVGVTLFPFDNADADTLLRDADQAMYAAKRTGRNRYHLFDAENDRLTRVHRDQIDGLRLALARDELRLHYQPKVNMKTGEVVGLEALVRWQHPGQGLLLPHAFLNIAEESSLIVHIGEWVLGEAMRQSRVWLAEGLRLPISVNIAASHLQRVDFVDKLAARLRANNADDLRDLIELEILESAALQDISAAQEVIERCRALGVSFAIDDFGTGYSSLTYFRRLSAEVLKIDQSFVRDMLSDPEDLAIVDGVIRLTEAFQRTVIAEGVESPEHGLVLLQLGCDLAQGFGIARPMPADEVPGWVRCWKPDPMWALATSRRVPREDFTLLAAPVAHKRWVEQLEAHVNAPAGTAVFPPPLDIKEFTFARWLAGPARDRYGDVPELHALIGAHGALHQLGRSVVELKREGHVDEAVARLPELRVLHERVLESLAVLLENARTARDR